MFKVFNSKKTIVKRLFLSTVICSKRSSFVNCFGDWGEGGGDGGADNSIFVLFHNDNVSANFFSKSSLFFQYLLTFE